MQTSEAVDAPAASAAPEQRIAAGDMAYHQRVLQQSTQLGPLADQARSLQQRIVMIQGAQVSWEEYLTSTYGLSDGDRVMPDGAIERGNQATG